ncbi:hypothetical protein ACOMHN_032806 [Nucella lapillus]
MSVVFSFSVLLLLSGLLMYPLGFSTRLFHYYCGDRSGVWGLGHCCIGWSYVLAITATALAIFCPVLSNFTDLSLMTTECSGGHRHQKLHRHRQRHCQQHKDCCSCKEKGRGGGGQSVTLV